MVQISKNVFCGGILAGGYSRRFGQDKASFVFEGTRLLDKQIVLLETLYCQPILVSCRREQSLAIPEGIGLLYDEGQNRGPIEGLRRLLSQCSASSRLIVIAVDMPGLTASFLQRLIQMAPDGLGLIPQQAGRYEPLCAIYPPSALPLVDQLISQKQFALQKLADICLRANHAIAWEIKPEEKRYFVNLNTPDP